MKQWIRASLGLAVLWPALAAVAQNTNSGDIRTEPDSTTPAQSFLTIT
jgi:hypothetical protein